MWATWWSQTAKARLVKGSKISPNGPGRTSPRRPAFGARRRFGSTTRRDVAMAVFADDPDPGARGVLAWSSSGAQASSSSETSRACRSRRGRTAGGRSRGGAGRRASGRADRRGGRSRRTGRSRACRPGRRPAPRRCGMGTCPARFEPIGQAVGRPGDPERLVAVARVVRLGRDAEVDAAPWLNHQNSLAAVNDRPRSARRRSSGPSRRSARPGSRRWTAARTGPRRCPGRTSRCRRPRARRAAGPSGSGLGRAGDGRG